MSSVDKVQPELGFSHRFIHTKDHNTPTLLLLHGTGGDENDLLPLGHQLDSKAGLLSPRGKVLERGMVPRYFRRLAEGVFDVQDLKFRTNELADFVERASATYWFDAGKVMAVGYSNGANIAASILLLRPETLSGAILFRAMVPLVPDTLPDLSGKRIFVSSGLRDPIVTKSEAETLANMLRQAGADVTLEWQDSGHELVEEDVIDARQWLEQTNKH
jgi:phospholipase/carboxylesterase/glyoxalase family protein